MQGQNAGVPHPNYASGSENTSIGSTQLTLLNGSGYNNTCVGNNNLTSVVSGIGNSVFGSYNLQSATSNLNSIFGYSCFTSTTTGSYNVGVGVSVFTSNITGSYNTGVGQGSGTKMLGICNTSIGVNSGQGNNDSNTYSYSTALGYNAIVNGSNQIVLGSPSETVYIPNALIVNGINIMTTLSGYVTTSKANTWIASQTFNNPIFQNVGTRVVSIGPTSNYPGYASGTENTSIGSTQLTSLGGSGTNKRSI